MTQTQRQSHTFPNRAGTGSFLAALASLQRCRTAWLWSGSPLARETEATRMTFSFLELSTTASRGDTALHRLQDFICNALRKVGPRLEDIQPILLLKHTLYAFAQHGVPGKSVCRALHGLIMDKIHVR